jgi:mRNA-degrading endonuclease RelE of RelBE toxin-antitoxin system
MDKIDKALRNLSSGELKVVKFLLVSISKNEFANLDIKKLKGRKDIFRARKGKIRIIYRIDDSEKIFLLAVERRSEKTYKFI